MYATASSRCGAVRLKSTEKKNGNCKLTIKLSPFEESPMLCRTESG